MRSTRFHVLMFSLICCFVLFLAACSPGGTTGNGGTPTPGATQAATSAPGTTPTSSANQTQNVPATQTSCPATGTGRAMVSAPLALGNHPNLVYVYNVGSLAHPGTSFLKRFDATTGAKTIIATLSNTYVANAQVSTNGQWILFVAYSSGQARLQLIRLDGQGLQTLYCGSQASGMLINPQWSTDQRHVVFGQRSSSGNQIFLLDVTTGKVQVEFSNQGGESYIPMTWLDNTRVYLQHQPTDAPADSLYLLDTSKGANQTTSNLQLVYRQVVSSSTYACWSADSSYNAQGLFVGECSAPASQQHPGEGAIEGPSNILSMASNGNAPRTIYHTMAGITVVRAVTSSLLLFTADSQVFDQGAKVDTSQNGLWVFNLSSAKATRLTTTVGNLNASSQFPWSNISRDSSYYSLQVVQGSAQSLEIGSLSGGAPTTVASTASGSTSDLSVAGWTTM